MMLDYSFNQAESSEAILNGVAREIQKEYRTGDISDGISKPAKTEEIGDVICKEIA